MLRLRPLVFVVVLLVVGPSLPAFAQQIAGCEAVRASNPPRVVYRCGGGMLLEAEAANALRLIAPSDDGNPQLIGVGGRAVYIEVEQRRLQILTPHAIASVRGTVFAVDVTSDATAVFVAEGRVHVSRRDGSEDVMLGPGEGVDVSPGEPMVVREWGAQRVDRLLARFGR